MRLSPFMHVFGIVCLAMLGFACIQLTDSFLMAILLWIVWCVPICWIVWRGMRLQRAKADSE